MEKVNSDALTKYLSANRLNTLVKGLNLVFRDGCSDASSGNRNSNKVRQRKGTLSVLLHIRRSSAEDDGLAQLQENVGAEFSWDTW